MGYAIFTARKLMLTNRVNQISFRIMQLTQQQQTLADNAAQKERAIANTRNLFSSIGNAFQMGMQMQTQAAMQNLNQSIQQNGGTPDASAMNAIGNILNGGNNFMATPMGMFMNVMNQSIEMSSQNDLRQVKEMENQIELQRKSLETQLNAAQKELEKVEQQEEKNIERSAPKFA